MPLLLGDDPHTTVAKGLLSSSPYTNAVEISHSILEIIFKYKCPLPQGTPDRSDEGALTFLGIIYRAVKMSQPVRMVLPAFPFKSPNSTAKVLGSTPDKAEDMALAHLNGMCAAIEKVYSPGSRLVIVSDGLVYNDLLGVPDSVVWNYGQKLRALTKARNYNNIEFACLKDLLSLDYDAEYLDDMSYAAAAPSIRFTLMRRYGPTGWDQAEKESYVKGNENKRLTYCGYLKFLELDLASLYPVGEGRSKSKFKKGVEKIAKSMLKRGEAFARAVRENFSNHVRLSIHPSNGMDKISIKVLPVSNIMTPWHSCIGFKLDGTMIAGHRSMFEEMADMELIHEDGKPFFFREKSGLYDWASKSVSFEPLYPCGLMIRPVNGRNSLTIEDINSAKVRALAEQNSPIILRGFSRTKDRERFVAKSYELGEPTAWKFGLVLEVKDCGSDGQGLNNVLSQEWMPFHFDGMFKTDKKKDETGREYLVPNPPRFQLFTAVTPSPKNTGFTLFANSRLLFQNLPAHVSMEQLQSLTWAVSTSSFDESKIHNMPLVVAHPTTGQLCLKYHERWPQEKTRFNPTFVEIENGDQTFCDLIEDLLHDRRVCYWHTWEEGDVLVNDNISMLHTRSSFESGASRELWRIHFN